MSYTEKPDEITKDEWMEKLNNLHVQRADMNRLIMNYLVTGEGCATGAASRAPFSLSGLTSKALPLEGPESEVAFRHHGNTVLL